MTGQEETSVVRAEAVEIADVVFDDVESGQANERDNEEHPNQKTCYTPILKQANDLYEQKIHPALMPLQEKVGPVIERVGDFFDDDEEDPIAQEETTDEDGNVTHKDATLFKVSPACLGAAVLGFGVTSFVIGPFIATSRHDTKAGEYSNFFGKKTYNGLSRGYKHSKKAILSLKGKYMNGSVENSIPAASSLEAA